jgi:4a-hydroxytetrahydrobiopterin dehydratase
MVPYDTLNPPVCAVADLSLSQRRNLIMSKVAPLTKQEVASAVSNLRNWSVKHGKLHAEFLFKDFAEAFAFMTKVAGAAEAAQHHPEWCNVYNRVAIDLMTHDAGNSISQRDIDLARQIDAFAG